MTLSPIKALLALLGCGGGGWSGADPITGITATNFKYGQLATLTLTGNALNNVIKLSSDKCLSVTNTSGISTFYTQTISVLEHQVTLVTTLGTVVMELNPTAAPITVKNFLSYVNQSPSFYNGTIFHRVLTGSVAQGGGYAVFGKVISGLNLIIQISNLTATSEKPNTEVVITSATQTQ